MSEFKILLVRQEWEYEDVAHIDMKEVSLKELLEHPDPEIQHELKTLGWANIKKLEDRAAKVSLNKKFYLLRPHIDTVRDLDALEKLQNFEVAELAQGGTILQEVSLKSVLSEDQYKHYLRVKNEIDAQRKKEKESQEKKAQRKAQKELDKAKKLLENHGLKVSDAK